MILRVNKNKLLEWVAKLVYASEVYRGWKWVLIPEYMFEDEGHKYYCVMYFKADLSVKKSIYMTRPNNAYPTHDEMKSVIEHNYDVLFKSNE